MRDSRITISKTSNTGAAILLGSVLGLILGGSLVTGFCGWKLWALNMPASAATGTTSASTTVPSLSYPAASYQAGPAGYAAPAISTDQASSGYSNYSSAPVPYGTVYPANQGSRTSSSPQPQDTNNPYDLPEFTSPDGTPDDLQDSAPSPSSGMPAVPNGNQADSRGQPTTRP